MKSVIIGGWNASGIYDAIQMGSEKLPSIAPYAYLNPLSNEALSFDENLSLSKLYPEELECFNPIPGGLFWSSERRGWGGGGFLARRDENAYKSSVTSSNHLKLGPCNY